MPFKTFPEASGTFAQNVEILGAANDIVPSENGIMHLFIEQDTAVLIQYTVDSGATWRDLDTPAVNILKEIIIPIVAGQQLNLRTNDVAGVTVVVKFMFET